MKKQSWKLLVISNLYPSEQHPNYGTFVRNFCRELDNLEVDYDKVVLEKGKLPTMINYLLYYIRVMLTILLNKYDVVYVHYASHNSIPILLVSKIKKINIYTNVHGGDVVPNTRAQEKLNKYTRRLLKKSKKIIVPSLYFKKFIQKEYSIKSQNISIYPSAGVNSKIFTPNNDAKNTNKKIIGFVGRIEGGKGWKTFVKSMFELENYNREYDYSICIIGNGIEYQELIESLRYYKLESKTTLIKSVTQEELANYYNNMDVFCLPTEARESLGLVVLEALACKVPVVVSNSGAPKYFVENNYNGFIIEKGNEIELAYKVDDILTMDSVNLNKLKENALKTAEMFYTENVRKELSKIIFK